MPQFVKFLFALTLRIVIVFGVIGMIIFALWGVLYLIFLKDKEPTKVESNTTVLLSKPYHLKSFS